jgi:hypothetical protein
MAKQSSIRTGGTARVRLVVLDAELPDGDLGALTQALQNALRSPTSTVVQRVTTANGTKAIQHQGAVEEAVLEPDEEIDEAHDAAPTSRQSRTKQRPVPRAPQIVDMDMNAPVSLATFAQGKDSKSQNKKYMIAAAWLKEHRGITSKREDSIVRLVSSYSPWNGILQDRRHSRMLRAFTSAGSKHRHVPHSNDRGAAAQGPEGGR